MLNYYFFLLAIKQLAAVSMVLILENSNLTQAVF